MGAAVDDVHHRHREDVCVRPADVAIERHVEFVGGRLGHREADAEDGVGAEAGLVLRAVEVDHQLVDRPLVERIETLDVLGDFDVDESDGVADALAPVAVASVA